MHGKTFTQKGFYTQKFLHTEAFTHREVLHREAFTQRSLATEQLCDVAKSQLLPFGLDYARMRCTWDFEIAILRQFRPFGLNFVWKGCIRNFEITILRYLILALGLISCEEVASEISKLQVYTSFWRSALISCQRATPRTTKFAFRHTFGRPTRTISTAGCSSTNKIRISPRVCASDTHILRRESRFASRSLPAP